MTAPDPDAYNTRNDPRSVTVAATAPKTATGSSVAGSASCGASGPAPSNAAANDASMCPYSASLRRNSARVVAFAPPAPAQLAHRLEPTEIRRRQITR